MYFVNHALKNLVQQQKAKNVMNFIKKNTKI